MTILNKEQLDKKFDLWALSFINDVKENFDISNLIKHDDYKDFILNVTKNTDAYSSEATNSEHCVRVTISPNNNSNFNSNFDYDGAEFVADIFMCTYEYEDKNNKEKQKFYYLVDLGAYDSLDEPVIEKSDDEAPVFKTSKEAIKFIKAVYKYWVNSIVNIKKFKYKYTTDPEELFAKEIGENNNN